MSPDIPEPCASCGGKCCNRFAVPITHLDVARLVEFTGKKPHEFCSLEDAQNISQNPYPKVFVMEEGKLVEKLLVLKRNKNNWCVFFARSNGCTVHNARPVVCRAYPFSLFGGAAQEKGKMEKIVRALGAFAKNAKKADMSNEHVNGEIYYTRNMVCPRAWAQWEYSEKEVLKDLKKQDRELKEYWKIANEWNAKRRKGAKQGFGAFLEFAVGKAQKGS